MKASFTQALGEGRLRPYQVAILVLITLGLVLDGVDLQVLPLVSPAIVAEWGVDRAEFGWPLSAAIIGMGVGAFFGGGLGDRFGRRNMLFASIAVFGGATVVASFANDIPLMTVLRFLGGLGFGAANPNALALVSEWMPQHLRTHVVALLAIGTPAGTMIGAALVPAMLPAFGWRGTYLIFGAVSLALGCAILALVRESPPFLLARGQGEKAHRHARLAVDGPLELLPERHEAEPEEDAGTAIGVFHPGNLRLNIGIAVSFAASTAIVYGLSGWSPLMLKGVGFADDQLTNANFALGLVSVIGALLAGPVDRHFGSRRTMAVCAGITCASIVALGLVIEGIGAAPSAAERWAVYSLVGVAGGVASIGIATIYAMMTLGYPLSCRSSGIGFGMMMGRMGGVGMSLAGGYLLDLGGRSVMPFFAVLAVCALVVSSSAWIVDRHIRPRGPG